MQPTVGCLDVKLVKNREITNSADMREKEGAGDSKAQLRNTTYV